MTASIGNAVHNRRETLAMAIGRGAGGGDVDVRRSKKPAMTRRFAGSSTVIAPHGALETPAAPARFYAKDNGLVFCDVAPFAYHGWKEYQDGVQKEFLETAESIKLTAGKKLKVTRRGMIAWTTEPMHLTEKSKDGKTSETNLRYTGICEKRVAKLGARSRAPFYTDSRELGS